MSNVSHTSEVLDSISPLLRLKFQGAYMNIAAGHLGISYATLRRRMLKQNLSMRQFAEIADLLECDACELYCSPQKVLDDVKNSQGDESRREFM